MAADELDHLKMKEQWLREELRSTRSLLDASTLKEMLGKNF